MLNLGEIRKIFDAYVPKIPTREEQEALRKARKPGPMQTALLVKGNLVLEGEHANDYFRLLEEVDRIAEPGGSWSKSSIEDLLVQSILEIIDSSPENRSDVIRAQRKILLNGLKAPLDEWIVDLQVAGLKHDCAGATFGKIKFLVGRVNQIPFAGTTDEPITIAFARVTVSAVDQQSAELAAARVVDEHLAILNELCVDWTPSRIHLYRGEDKPPNQQHVRRIRKVSETQGSRGQHHTLTGTLLSRQELDGFLQLRGGKRVSEWLTHRTGFGNRLIAAYVTAGSACVEPKPFLAFLLFAVALESVLLGGEYRAGIAFRLSVHVAHLLGKTTEVRKAIAARVKKLYGLRSTIAHEGACDVSESDLAQMRLICLRCIHALTSLPDFAGMQTEEELDQWFQNRMLGAS